MMVTRKEIGKFLEGCGYAKKKSIYQIDCGDVYVNLIIDRNPYGGDYGIHCFILLKVLIVNPPDIYSPFNYDIFLPGVRVKEEFDDNEKERIKNYFDKLLKGVKKKGLKGLIKSTSESDLRHYGQGDFRIWLISNHYLSKKIEKEWKNEFTAGFIRMGYTNKEIEEVFTNPKKSEEIYMRALERKKEKQKNNKG